MRWRVGKLGRSKISGKMFKKNIKIVDQKCADKKELFFCSRMLE